MPVQGGPYRRLTATTATEGEMAEIVSQELKAWKGSHTVNKKAQRKRKNRKLQNAEAKDAQSMFAEATVLPYVNDLVRGNLCAFVSGHLDEVDQVEVAVMSVLQFLPGMRVAVAADSAGFDAYDRYEPGFDPEISFLVKLCLEEIDGYVVLIFFWREARACVRTQCCGGGG